MNFEKSCGAVIYRENKGRLEYLLISHKIDGHWCFPKGHVEGGESEKETALREIYEETALEVDLDEKFRMNINYRAKKNISKEVIFFLGKASIQRVAIQMDEVRDYKWVGFQEANSILTYDKSKGVLKEAHEFLILQHSLRRI